MANRQEDAFAVLGAIWILASIDEDPVITYRGIEHRLNLSNSFGVRGLVRSHAELFRLGMSDDRLNDWKKKFKDDLQARKHPPSWLREVPGDERPQHVDALTTDDVFRSQFRAVKGAPKSEVAIIDWGLGHIERLRKANSERRDATAKSWQMWLVFITSIFGVVATIIAALLRH